MAKHILVYHDKTADSYGGARFNGLAFYDKFDNQIPVSDIKRGTGNNVEFIIKGIKGRVEIISPYSDGSYPLINIFKTTNGYGYATMTTTKKAFHIYFDSDVRGISYITLKSTYLLANDWHIEVDGRVVNEDPVKAQLDTYFKLPVPPGIIKCMRGKNGHYFFLRKPKPETQETTGETS